MTGHGYEPSRFWTPRAKRSGSLSMAARMFQDPES